MPRTRTKPFYNKAHSIHIEVTVTGQLDGRIACGAADLDDLEFRIAADKYNDDLRLRRSHGDVKAANKANMQHCRPCIDAMLALGGQTTEFNP